MATGLDMVLPRAAWLWGCPWLAGGRECRCGQGLLVGDTWVGETWRPATRPWAMQGTAGQATPTSEIWGDLVEAKARSGRTSCPQVLRGLQAPAPNLCLPLLLTVHRLETPKGVWAELGRSCSTWSAGEGRQGGTTAAPHRATPSALARCLARGSGEGLRGNLSPHP